MKHEKNGEKRGIHNSSIILLHAYAVVMVDLHGAGSAYNGGRSKPPGLQLGGDVRQLRYRLGIILFEVSQLRESRCSKGGRV